MRSRLVFIFALALAISACTSHATAPIGDANTLAVPYVLQNGATPRAWVKLPAGATPLGGAFAGDGNFWFSEPSTGAIASMDMRGNVSTHTITGGVSGAPILGPDGALWFGTWTSTSQFIGRITTAGAVTTFPLSGQSGQLGGYAFGSDGRLWIDETTVVLAMTTAGSVTSYPQNFSRSGPAPAMLGPDGQIWIAEPEMFLKYDTAGNESGVSYGPKTSLQSEAVGPDGDVWFTTPTAVGKLPVGGNFVFYPVSPAPLNITRIGSHLYAPAQGSSMVYRFNTNGTHAHFSSPFSGSANVFLAHGPDGNTWFDDPAVNDVAVKVYHILVVNPTHWTLTAGSQKAMTVTETSYAGAWTVTSSNPSSVTVTANATRGSYTINGVASGSATITTEDSMGNVFDTPITVL